MKHCEICGQEACDGPMTHLTDECLMEDVMEMNMGHPMCYCPECGHEHDVEEPDAEPRPCEVDMCPGSVRHPQQVLEII